MAKLPNPTGAKLIAALQKIGLFRILYADFAGLNEFSELSAWSHSPKMFLVNIYIQDPIEPKIGSKVVR